MFRGDVGGKRIELGLGARYEDKVVAFCCKGERKLLANAVRSPGYESPCAAGSEVVELVRSVTIRNWRVILSLTDLPGSTNKLSRTLMVLTMGAAKAATPTSRKPYTAAWTKELLASTRTPKASVMLDILDMTGKEEKGVTILQNHNIDYTPTRWVLLLADGGPWLTASRLVGV
jgi:hypothetical protein